DGRAREVDPSAGNLDGGPPRGGGPCLKLVLAEVPGVRTAVVAVPGEVVISAGLPVLAVVPVRLPGGDTAVGCRPRITLDIATPSDMDGVQLVHALVNHIERPQTRGAR